MLARFWCYLCSLVVHSIFNQSSNVSTVWACKGVVGASVILVNSGCPRVLPDLSCRGLSTKVPSDQVTMQFRRGGVCFVPFGLAPLHPGINPIGISREMEGGWAIAKTRRSLWSILCRDGQSTQRTITDCLSAQRPGLRNGEELAVARHRNCR